MSAYTTIVVGTDGSESSLRAVERAASLAAASKAELIVACAYLPQSSSGSAAAADVLRDEAYQLSGDNPTNDILRIAKGHAQGVGADNIALRAIKGAPVDALLNLVHEVQADLLVIGNKGLTSLTGRLLGSVPSDAARKSVTDVLIVHTT